MRKIGVILLSGGLDSTTVAAYALKQEFELTGITLHYGQRHNREIGSARKIARLLGIKHEIIDISFFKKLAWYSALTNPERFKIPNRRSIREMSRIIPITYVPLRNTFFITLAAAFLESTALNMIEKQNINSREIEAAIFIAANAIDYSGYPDCRPEYYEQMTRALLLGSKLGTQYNLSLKIETPVILKTKAEIIQMAQELKAPLEYTWSCYEGGEMPCGKCDSCVLRAKGFAEAGCLDPLLARLEKERSGFNGK